MKTTGYHRVANAALEWVEHNLPQFRPPPVGSADFVPLLKPLGELALTGNVLSSWSRDGHRRKHIGHEFVRFAWELVGKGNTLRLIVLEKPDLWAVLSVYATFVSHGFRNEPLEKALSAVTRCRSFAAMEFPSWRKIEIGLACKKLGFACPWDIRKCLSATWLGHLPEPWLLSTTAAYSVTHTVFYVTSFGQRPAALSQRCRDYLASWLPAWMEFYLHLKNYDLLAEMLMAARCLNLSIDGDWEAALIRAQRADGRVSGPQGNGRGLDPTVRSQSRRRFLDDYHTTLVVLMAAVMAECKHSQLRPREG
jgi:hypothetical protein